VEEKERNIDTAGRRAIASALRDFLACRTTDKEFESSVLRYLERRLGEADDAYSEIRLFGLYPKYTLDPGIDAVMADIHVRLCVNLVPIRLEGKCALSAKEWTHVQRDLLFLESELPYEWNDPEARPYNFLQHVFWFLGNLFSCFWPARAERRAYEAQGELEVWPFLHREDYLHELERCNANAEKPPAGSAEAENE
jgi:hypothetical protein